MMLDILPRDEQWREGGGGMLNIQCTSITEWHNILHSKRNPIVINYDTILFAFCCVMCCEEWRGRSKRWVYFGCLWRGV